VQANDLNLSIHNPILIYSFLAAYGLMTVTLLLYVQSKFRHAAKLLQALQAEWSTADSRHAGFVGKAQEQIAKLSAPAPAAKPVKTSTVNLDIRNQVVAMGKKGFTAPEIAKTCGLQEGDVEVLLGMARLQK
jgi:hypothetical protein